MEMFRSKENRYISSAFTEWESKINSSNSICMHFRGTDVSTKYHNFRFLNQAFYGMGLMNLKEHLSSSSNESGKSQPIFVFTDEPEFVSEVFESVEDIFVVSADQRLSYLDEF